MHVWWYPGTFLSSDSLFCIITELFLQSMPLYLITPGNSLTSVFRSCRMSPSRSSLDKSTAFCIVYKNFF